MRIFIFGDSIAQGFYDERGGWAQQLANHFHQKTLLSMNTGSVNWVEVHCLGVSGDNAESVERRLENEIVARRIGEDNMELVILAVGANDVILRNNEAALDVYEFQERMEKLTEKAKKVSENVVLIGLTAVDESLTNPWKFSSSGKQWFNERLNLFEDTIKQCAMTHDVLFIPIHDEFKRLVDANKNVLADGLHPNSAGHAFIYSKIQPEIEELIS